MIKMENKMKKNIYKTPVLAVILFDTASSLCNDSPFSGGQNESLEYEKFEW